MTFKKACGLIIIFLMVLNYHVYAQYRLSLSLEFPSSARASIHQKASDLESDIKNLYKIFNEEKNIIKKPGNWWVHQPSAFHITLIYFSNNALFDQKTCTKIIDIIKQTLTTQPSLDAISIKAQPAFIGKAGWVAYTFESARLKQLVAQLCKNFKDNGIALSPLSEGPFTAHVSAVQIGKTMQPSGENELFKNFQNLDDFMNKKSDTLFQKYVNPISMSQRTPENSIINQLGTIFKKETHTLALVFQPEAIIIKQFDPATKTAQSTSFSLPQPEPPLAQLQASLNQLRQKLSALAKQLLKIA